MALATQCPFCQTTFRVANDQLKLRAGLVRCGSCREVFNGIENLVRPGQAATDGSHGSAVAVPLGQNEAVAPVAPTFKNVAPHLAAATMLPGTLPLPSNPLGPDTQLRPPEAPAEHRPASPAAPLFTPRLSSLPPSASAPLPPVYRTPSVSSMTQMTPLLPDAAPVAPIALVPKAESIRSVSPTKAIEVAPPQSAAGRIAPHLNTARREPTIAYSLPTTSGLKSPNVWQRLNTHDAGGGNVEIDNDKGAPNVPPIGSNLNDADPLQRMTLFQVASTESLGDGTSGGEDDELDRLIDELQNRQWKGTKKAAPEPSPEKAVESNFVGDRRGYDRSATDTTEDAVNAEPRFMRQAQHQQRLGGAIRLAMWIGSIVFAIALLAQAGYLYRDHLAASVPLLKPLLQRVCSKLGCQIGLPTNIDGLSIESNELQLIDPARNLFALTVLMRNRSSTVQAWPTIELTLNDGSEKAIARRAFPPAEYLPVGTDGAEGFRRNTEQPVKLTFELLQLKASGYRVYLFYP
ncbi:DUF3426 domain-containing protein [Glaciimonas immobilis]|uniref:Putative Zn finger-like uncharacterized protein n=1 Tax=Glaciimonas immobilis TaxID=728004 RepID=A0A840RWT1_9BURK|nr:DUF3426 domain-containing protein [Glaciimonas immobilis]KAF3997416.1 DUF3426 domain-containing protein [Glaciimonas immobilis]MBB5200920.1 putative Zn finger-like uncharacterized protein [Glaciimonas immobilis]